MCTKSGSQGHDNRHWVGLVPCRRLGSQSGKNTRFSVCLKGRLPKAPAPPSHDCLFEGRIAPNNRQ